MGFSNRWPAAAPDYLLWRRTTNAQIDRLDDLFFEELSVRL
jgi:hypothetical protein